MCIGCSGRVHRFDTHTQAAQEAAAPGGIVLARGCRRARCWARRRACRRARRDAGEWGRHDAQQPRLPWDQRLERARLALSAALEAIPIRTGGGRRTVLAQLVSEPRALVVELVAARARARELHLRCESARGLRIARALSGGQGGAEVESLGDGDALLECLRKAPSLVAQRRVRLAQQSDVPLELPHAHVDRPLRSAHQLAILLDELSDLAACAGELQLEAGLARLERAQLWLRLLQLLLQGRDALRLRSHLALQLGEPQRGALGAVDGVLELGRKQQQRHLLVRHAAALVVALL